MTSNRRKHPRYDFPYSIKYVLNYNFPYSIRYVLNPDTNHQVFDAVAINISKSGLRFYTPNLLEEGQKITIKTILPTPSQNAVVRWIKKFDEFYNTVGLEFI